MRSFTYRIHIDRTPPVVWACMMDFARAPRWRNLVRQIEAVTPPPIGVGSELRITFDLRGTAKSLVSEVWAFEPARRFGLRNTEQGITGVFEYQLAPDGAGTRVVFTCDIKPHGLRWLLLPLLIPGNRRRYAEQLPRLKAEVERDTIA